MNLRNLTKLMIGCALASIFVSGCNPQNPDVVVTPPSTTVVHDQAPNKPDVIVTPSSPSTHTDTHTNTTTPPTTGGAATSTTTTSTGGG